MPTANNGGPKVPSLLERDDPKILKELTFVCEVCQLRLRVTPQLSCSNRSMLLIMSPWRPCLVPNRDVSGVGCPLANLPWVVFAPSR